MAVVPLSGRSSAGRRGRWDAYRDVNERFADAIAREYRQGDSIWVHDYQLMLVPALVWARVPTAKIGFFLHIPFPSSKVFRILPVTRIRRSEDAVIADATGDEFSRHHSMRHLDARCLARNTCRTMDMQPVRVALWDVRAQWEIGIRRVAAAQGVLDSSRPAHDADCRSVLRENLSDLKAINQAVRELLHQVETVLGAAER
jgi:hypothetical protein